VAKTTSGFNSDCPIRQYAHGLLLESPFIPSTIDCWAVRAKIKQKRPVGAKPEVWIWLSPKKSTFWPWFPIHSLRPFLAKTYRFATIQNVRDDRQTLTDIDRRTTKCAKGATDSTVGQKCFERFYNFSFEKNTFSAFLFIFCLSIWNSCMGQPEMAGSTKRVLLMVLRHVRREWALLSFHSVCLSGCLLVIPRPRTAYHDWSITTKFGRQVYTCPRTRVSFFGSPISHTFGARWKNMQNFA